MTHSEIQRRNQLIELIQKTPDQNVIDEIYRMLRISFDDKVLVTSAEQKRAIALSQMDIAAGKSISEEDADREIEEWLRK
jgi:hypothetical protein